MRQLTVLALNTWKEFLRNKGMFTIIATLCFILLFSHLLQKVASGSDNRLVQTTGFFCIGLFGILCNIFMGGVFIREINEKNIYLILVRPIKRSTFVVGKFLGHCLTLVTIFVCASLIWYFILTINFVPVTPIFFTATLFILGEWIIIASISLFLGSFTTPLLHAIFLFSFVFIGHFSKDIVLYSITNTSLWLKNILIYSYYAIPNLELLNFKTTAIYSHPVDISQLFAALLLVCSWSVVFITGACIIFSFKKVV
ncbi:hypothetical protein [uncultured Desulfobacter sp.]|uniref:ABC transporter permease n=1 Tax=uncultured Desulfobacter sp. TaxID=240139 RepID=UPI0029F4EC09|nr:hypothetical protein [uncultured Desulfobacter sp.]